MVDIQTNIVYKQLEESDKRISVFQGGTRSGKTYNISIWFIIKLLNEENKILTVARQTLPSLKNTVFRDYKENLIALELWDSNNFNKSEMIYKLGSNIIEFRNLDDDQKVRGAKRNYLHLNEANETPKPIWKQLLFRTTEKIVLDYNPSDEYHYIYDEVITRDDCDFYRSTFLDNPFLPDQLVKEIMRLKDVDPNYWRVYGLGERGMSETTIYTNWELTDEEKPKGYNCYGLDFGFNDPNALIDMVIVDCEEPYIWLDELLYQNKLTTPELVEHMKTLGLTRNDTIFGDNSRPETIQEIHNCGFNIKPCVKGKGSVKSGIDWIKRYKLKITKRSLNLIKETRSYKWKVDKNETVLDEPVDLNNHGLDAVRYSLSDKVESLTPFSVGVLDNFNF